jgi:enterochelin esterase family protein
LHECVKAANVAATMLEITSCVSRVLADNPLGDPSTREVGVYLPPSYDGHKRFPLVILLPGFTGTGLQLLNRGAWQQPIDRRLEALFRDGRAREIILLLPDCFTRYGGSQYVDSPAIGRYASYLTEELLPWTDARYRTIPRREARAVIGKSSGGYGALQLGMRRNDLFCAVGSHAGDCAFELSYQRELGHTAIALERRGGIKGFLEWFGQQVQKPGHAIEVMSILCCAAAWSPTSGPYGVGEGFELPFDRRTGALIPEVWSRWLAEDPLRMIDRHLDALRAMSAIFLDAGLHDEYNLQLGTRQISDKLRAAGIAHTHEEFDGGHMNTQYRYDRSFAVLSHALATE